jgi:phosphoribosylaminoimidazole-succinocarboxamide synthase
MANLRDLYREMREANIPVTEHSYKGLSQAQLKALNSKGIMTYTGKVRDLLINNDNLIMVHSDKLSAFDRHVGLVPYKGVILNEISKLWFKKIDGKLPHHLLFDDSSPRSLKVKKCDPIKIEVIVRGYLAGSMLRAYEKGQREFCGHKLPEGLKPYEKLPTPIITPTTKAEVYEHDEEVSARELVERGLASQEQWEQISGYAFSLFAIGQAEYHKAGWILVDTKYEFGVASGKIMVIDEIHTPDSSRLWKQETYVSQLEKGEPPEMLDKEIVRSYLASKGFRGEGDVPDVPQENLVALGETYLEVYEKLSGELLEVDGRGEAFPLSI